MALARHGLNQSSAEPRAGQQLAGEQIAAPTHKNADSVCRHIPRIAAASGNKVLRQFVQATVSHGNGQREQRVFTPSSGSRGNCPAQQEREPGIGNHVAKFVRDCHPGQGGCRQVRGHKYGYPVRAQTECGYADHYS